MHSIFIILPRGEEGSLHIDLEGFRTQSSCEWFPVEDGKKCLSLPWFHTSPGDWLFITVVILFQPISEAKPKAVVSLRSYFPALGTGYKYLLSRILIGFPLLLVIGCPKQSRYSFNQSLTCDKKRLSRRFFPCFYSRILLLLLLFFFFASLEIGSVALNWRPLYLY